MENKELDQPVTHSFQMCKHVERYSIIRLADGRLAVWERKTFMAITEWGKMAVKLSGETPVEVVYNPCQLAAMYLKDQSEPRID